MSIYCEINLDTPPNGAFVGVCGNVISGVIKYVINVPMTITAISVSIEGTGTLQIEYLQKKDDEENPEKDIRRENYLDANILTQNIVAFLGPGVYEIPFRVELPHDIPPSLNYHKKGFSHNISCEILYHVQIVFHIPDFFPFRKLFRKDINIIAGLVPRLSMTSVIHNGEKKLTQLFSSKKSYVKVKANIFNSVLRCGEKIQIHYEVINDTNIVIKGIKVKVVEVLTFKPINGEEIIFEEKVPDTDSTTESLSSGETREMLVDINMPVDRESLDFSNIVSKDYFVLISVKLPMPHRNYELRIPVQFGHTLDERGFVNSDYNPGLRWESMCDESDSVQ